MKTTSLLALGLLATALAVIGAHPLAERFDPTARAVKAQPTQLLADDGDPSGACFIGDPRLS